MAKVHQVLLVVTILLGISIAARPRLLTSGEVVARAQRVLQANTFGTYTVVAKPEVAEKCNNEGIDPKDFSVSDEDLKSGMDSTTGRYLGPRDILIQVVSQMKADGVKPKDLIGGVVGHVIIPLVFAVLSILTFFFFIFYTLCACCCKKTCCMKPIKQGDPLTKGQKCILFSSLAVGIALLVCTIVWVIQMGVTINRIKYFPCAVATMYSDIDNGYVGDGFNFIGVKGVQSMINDVKITINNFVNGVSGPDMSAIVANDMPTQGTTVLNNLNTLVSQNDPTSASKTNTYTTTEVTEPADSIKAISNTIGSGLKTEVTNMNTFSQGLHHTARIVAGLINTGTGNMNSAFDTLNSQISPLSDKLKSLYDVAANALPIGTIKSLMTIAMVVAICFVAVGLILYFVVMYFSLMKDKCHCLKFIPKLFMILKALIAIFFFVLVGLLGAICIVMSNVCYFLYRGTTDVEFANKIDQDQVKKMFVICILPGGSGELSAFLDDSNSLGQIGDFNKTLQSLYSMDQYTSQFGGATPSSPVGGPLDTLYADSSALKRDDFTTSSTYGLKTNIDGLNNIFVSKNLNHFRLVGEAVPSGWNPYGGTAFSAATDQNGAKDSLPLNFIPGGTTGSSPTGGPRYVAAGSVSSGEASSANTYYNNLWKARNYMAAAAAGTPTGRNYGDWVATWSAFYGTTATANTLMGYYENIRVNFGKLQNVKTQATNMLNFVAKFQGDIFKAMNCRILSKEIKTVEVATCVKFTASLMNTTTSMFAMSVLLFFFAWCICCGIRCAPKKDINQVNPANEPSNALKAGKGEEAAPLQQSIAKPVGASPVV